MDDTPPRAALDTCAFCTQLGQPGILFETPSLYVVPDKFPLIPGHMLIISKEHVACYAAASHDVLNELEQAAAFVRRFLRDAYGAGPGLALWENGVRGQSIFHAHAHLFPTGGQWLQPSFATTYDGVLAVDSWDTVKHEYQQSGGYRLVDFEDSRYLLTDENLAMKAAHEAFMAVIGVEYADGEWRRTTTAEDVAEAARRWGAWMAAGQWRD